MDLVLCNQGICPRFRVILRLGAFASKQNARVNHRRCGESRIAAEVAFRDRSAILVHVVLEV